MRSAAGSIRLGVLAVAAALGVSCAARLPPRPAGPSTASPEAVAAFATATAHCSGLRSLGLELGLSGHAGDEKIRGRVLTGLQRGGAARLEGVAPFGAPVFILVARGEEATLLLPRDHRVLRGTPVASVIERLTGLRLGADDLLLALSGCVGAGESTDGRQWTREWRSVSLPGERTVFLREQAGAWNVAAVDGPGWRADYGHILNRFPRQVRLRSSDGQVDLAATVQQLDVNVSLEEAAFEVAVPPGTEPMTLEELRSVAPLRTP